MPIIVLFLNPNEPLGCVIAALSHPHRRSLPWSGSGASPLAAKADYNLKCNTIQQTVKGIADAAGCRSLDQKHLDHRITTIRLQADEIDPAAPVRGIHHHFMMAR